jgi:1,4-dihydroxy-2-naphthoate octaprenyltransferase
MTSEGSGADPSVRRFSGDAPAQVAKRLFNATRPKFFPASVLPVLAGTAWGASVAGTFDGVVLFLALLSTVCVHAGANVLNDVGDDAIGTDRINDDMIHPYTGGSRFIQEGIMSPAGMARLGISLLVVAAVGGFVLLSMKGATVLAFGVAGVTLATLYSLGPARLSCLGLGELAVGIGFGVLPVCGAAWLQSGVLDTSALLFSLPVSAWVANILLINEVPDRRADGATGKRTLPVRVGLDATARLYIALHVVAAVAVVWLTARGALPLLAPLVPIGLLAMALPSARAIRAGVDRRETLTQGIETTLAIHTIGTLWLTGCALYLLLFSAG